MSKKIDTHKNLFQFNTVFKLPTNPDLNVQAIIKCIESLEATNLVPGFFDNLKILLKIIKIIEQSNSQDMSLSNNQQVWL